MHRISIIDSHTGGEPTRVVTAGGPPLGSGPLADRVARFRHSFDTYRSAIVNEPRGNDVLVGALLVEPHEPDCAAGVIFFNNVGYLGMCGHGMIGLIVTLAHLGRIKPGDHRIDTPVGVVVARLHPDGTVSVTNVPSYRKGKAIEIDLGGGRKFRGDLAWAGNWFFLVQNYNGPIALSDLATLLQVTGEIRKVVNAQVHAEVDHIELFGPPATAGAHSKNFVLCPGGAYDRSPCGTGTSAKLACLAADGKLAEGEIWMQESIIGSRFTGSFRWIDRDAGMISPTITGSAFVSAEATLLLDESDPFRWGIPV